MKVGDVDQLDWDKGDGLLPAIVQDELTRQVLMLGYVDREALTKTIRDGRVTFYSRSKRRLWTKGETSGNHLELRGAHADCDRDAVLLNVVPLGPACHRDTTSCFDEKDAAGVGFLGYLWKIICARDESRPAGSYTTELLEAGLRRMAQKVGEEGVEVALAGVDEDPHALGEEAADLLFHLWVLLLGKRSDPRQVMEVLRRRHAGRKEPKPGDAG